MNEPEVQKVSDWRSEAAARRESIAATVERLGLSVESDFIPWSRSRNAGEKEPSLNWRVWLRRYVHTDGTEKPRVIVETLYSAGMAHCPSYSQRDWKTVDGNAAVRQECETGRSHKHPFRREPIELDALDVIASLVLDASVLEAGGFEEWAAEMGWDADSRKAEATWKECLDIALKMRQGVGEAGMVDLAEAFREW